MRPSTTQFWKHGSLAPGHFPAETFLARQRPHLSLFFIMETLTNRSPSIGDVEWRLCRLANILAEAPFFCAPGLRSRLSSRVVLSVGLEPLAGASCLYGWRCVSVNQDETARLSIHSLALRACMVLCEEPLARASCLYGAGWDQRCGCVRLLGGANKRG